MTMIKMGLIVAVLGIVSFAFGIAAEVYKVPQSHHVFTLFKKISFAICPILNRNKLIFFL